VEFIKENTNNINIMQYKMVKRNKRLIIVDSNDKLVYGMPDFLRNHLRDRKELQKLVDKFNIVGYRNIQDIVEFETNLRK